MNIRGRWKNIKDEYKQEIKKYDDWEDKKERMRKRLWLKLYGTTDPKKIKELKRRQQKVPLTQRQARRMVRLGKIRKGMVKGVVKTVRGYQESEKNLQALEERIQRKKQQVKKIGQQFNKGHEKFITQVEKTFPQQAKKRKKYKKKDFDLFKW